MVNQKYRVVKRGKRLRLAEGWKRLARPMMGFYRDAGEVYRVVYNPRGPGVVIDYCPGWDEPHVYLPTVYRTIREAGKALTQLMVDKGILK